MHPRDEAAMQLPLVIKGSEGMVTRFSKCCRPIPGDPVVGVITGGRGMMIHTQTCRNIADDKYPGGELYRCSMGAGS